MLFLSAAVFLFPFLAESRRDEAAFLPEGQKSKERIEMGRFFWGGGKMSGLGTCWDLVMLLHQNVSILLWGLVGRDNRAAELNR